MNNIRICKRCNNERECPYNKIYCRECQNLFCREYKEKNKEKIKEYNKNYKNIHKEEIKEYNKEYNVNNRKTIQNRQTKNNKERRTNDIKYKLTINLRNRIKKFFKGEEISSSKYIECSIENFKSWISYQFEYDMSFENYGTLWHLDHVIPCSLFNFNNEIEKYYCFNWSNYRPLYKEKNLSRQNKLSYKDILLHDIIIKSFIINNKYLKIHNFNKLKYINT